MTRSVHTHRSPSCRTRRSRLSVFGVGALAVLAVVASACSSDKGTANTISPATSGNSSASTTSGGGSTIAPGAASIDPCGIVTEAMAVKVYGAGSTITTSPSSDKRNCQVSIQGLSYELSIHVGPAAEYAMQKSVAFENPTVFPGLGKEAVIGKSSDNTGAHLGLLYRTDSGAVYISNESDQAKLTALAGAIAAGG